VNVGEWLTVAQTSELEIPDNSWMSRPLERGEFLDWTNSDA
jgi:hypothetical protein